MGWRGASRVFAVLLVACAPVAALVIRATPPDAASRSQTEARSVAHIARLPHGQLALFTLGSILAYGALEAVVVHRVAGRRRLPPDPGDRVGDDSPGS